MKRVCGSLVCLVFLGILGVTSLQAQDGFWTQLTPTGSLPTACGYPSAVYDSARDRILVFGGVVWATSFNDVWALSLGGSPQWTQLAPSGPLPNTRHNHAAIYDPVRDRMIIFGGGRYHEGPWNDVWALSLGGSPHWTQLVPTGVPPDARAGFNAIYDPLRDRMLIFGGGGAAGAYNDVWALSLGPTPEWTELTPSGTPPSPRGAPVIYDPVRDRMVLFGGGGPTGSYNDVWALSLGGSPQWTQLTPSGTPPVPRGGFTTIYDAAGDRMIVFGGNRIDHAAYLGNNEVWALPLGDSPQWTQLAPSGTLPIGRYSHMAVYDPVRGRMIVTCGDSYYGTYLNDTWALSWGPTSAVSVECPADMVVPGYSTIPSLSLVGFRITNVGTIASAFSYSVEATGPATLVDKGNPASLSGTTPVLDPGASYYPPEAELLIPAIREDGEQRITYHANVYGEPMNSQSCMTVVTFGSPLAVFVSAFDATALEDAVELSWEIVSDEEVLGFKVYRLVEGAPASEDLTSGGLIAAHARTYRDEGVARGYTYAYTLAVSLTGGSEVRSQTVTAKTEGYAFALHQNAPNPFNPTTTISFTLPEEARAALVIYDVNGRSVKTLADDVVGEGYHERVWDGTDQSGSHVGSGVYFCRLTAGGRTLTRKLVLLK